MLTIFGSPITDSNRRLLVAEPDLACALRHEGQSLEELYRDPAFTQFFQNPEGSPFQATKATAGNYALRVVKLPSAPTWDRRYGDSPKDGWELCPIPIAVHAALLSLREGQWIVPEHHMGSCIEDGGSGHRAAFYIAREHSGQIYEFPQIRVVTTASAVNIGAILRIESKLLQS